MYEHPRRTPEQDSRWNTIYWPSTHLVPQQSKHKTGSLQEALAGTFWGVTEGFLQLPSKVLPFGSNLEGQISFNATSRMPNAVLLTLILFNKSALVERCLAMGHTVLSAHLGAFHSYRVLG